MEDYPNNNEPNPDAAKWQNLGEVQQENKALPPSAEELMDGCKFKEYAEDAAETMLNMSYAYASLIVESDNTNSPELSGKIEGFQEARIQTAEMLYGEAGKGKITEFDEFVLAQYVAPHYKAGLEGLITEDANAKWTLESNDPAYGADYGEEDYESSEYTFSEKIRYWLDYEPSENALPDNLDNVQTKHQKIPVKFAEIHREYLKHRR